MDDETKPLGETITGRAASPEMGWSWTWANAGEGVVPPFPGIAIVAPATPPPPARLDGADTLEEWCTKVLATWASGFARYWPRKGRPYSHAEVAHGGRWRKGLEAACWQLFGEEIPPAMWMRWKFEGWLSHPPEGVDPRRTPPLLRVMLHAPTIAKQAGWFQRESSTFGVLPSVLGPRHKALLHNHRAMTDALIVSGATAPEDVRRMVEKFFPRGSWETMVDDAKFEAMKAQRALEERARQGEWPW